MRLGPVSAGCAAALLVVLGTAGAAAAAGRAAAVPAGPVAAAERIDEQWVLEAVHASGAWPVTRGAGVTVAVLDTGVDASQPDLAGRVVEGPDLTGEQINPAGPHWGEHGTEMASLIAGAGLGITGVAPQARILSVRVIQDSDDPQPTPSARPSQVADPVAAGIVYAVDHGARVINMSLGTVDDSAPDQAQASAIDYAVSHGVVVVAAAGNDADKGNAPSYPAAFPGVIAVGAVDRNGDVAGFSTRRWYTSVVAPGVGVPGDLPHTTSQFIVADGTSPATALVAGAAALVLAANPHLSPAQVRSVLESTADDRPPGGFDPAQGFGTVDVSAAVHAALGMSPVPRLPQAAPTTEADGGTLAVAGQPQAGPAAVAGPRPLSWWWQRAALAGLLALVFLSAAWRLALPRRRAGPRPASGATGPPAAAP